MRTTREIKREITTRFMANQTLAKAYGFAEGAVFENEFSLLSLENLLFDIVTYAIFILEKLFDQHHTEVTQKIYEQKIGSLRWYRNKALDFQYGFDLLKDTDKFINGDASEDIINQSKIVKYAAVTEAEQESRVIIKIAGEQQGKLSPIDQVQQAAFDAYVDEIRFAGTNITVINFEPDRLYLTINIYRDPLVLDENGVSILNGNIPVNDALEEFMKELPFNGELTIQNLVDKLQVVEGVIIVDVINVESSWIDAQSNSYGNPETISVKKIPESGYFEIQGFDNINYVV